MQCKQSLNKTYFIALRKIKTNVSLNIINIKGAWIFFFISECYKVSRQTFMWLDRPFLCQFLQKGKSVTLPRILWKLNLASKAYDLKYLKSADRILYFVVVNRKYVVFSIKLKKSRGFPINNDNIYFMRLTVWF